MACETRMYVAVVVIVVLRLVSLIVMALVSADGGAVGEALPNLRTCGAFCQFRSMFAARVLIRVGASN